MLVGLFPRLLLTLCVSSSFFSCFLIYSIPRRLCSAVLLSFVSAVKCLFSSRSWSPHASVWLFFVLLHLYIWSCLSALRSSFFTCCSLFIHRACVVGLLAQTHSHPIRSHRFGTPCVLNPYCVSFCISATTSHRIASHRPLALALFCPMHCIALSRLFLRVPDWLRSDTRCFASFLLFVTYLPSPVMMLVFNPHLAHRLSAMEAFPPPTVSLYFACAVFHCHCAVTFGTSPFSHTVYRWKH